MYKLKLIFMGSLLALSFVLVGCQGNNSDVVADGTTEGGTIPTDPILPDNPTGVAVITPILVTTTSEITQNNQVVPVVVTVIDAANRPYSEGNIEIIYPNDVRQGRDVGSFDKITSPIINGKATFAYTAPSDLSVNTNNIVFGFFHDSNSSVNIAYTFTVKPDANQIIHSSYELVISDPTDVLMGRNDTKDIAFTVQSKAGIVVDVAKITSVSATIKEAEKATMIDSSIATATTSITRTDVNPLSITVKSNDISGIVPIEVNAVFTGSDGKEVNLTKIFNIIVLSGPPSSASIEYIGSEFNSGKYTETWVLKAVDEDGNPVNTSPSISSGILVGYTLSSKTNAPADYLYYSGTPGGTLSSVASKGVFTSATAGVFDNVAPVTDKLVIMGTGYTFNALGKWEIENVTTTALELKDDFTASDISGLTFAVGNNLRNERCNDIITATAEVVVVNPILDGSGKSILKIEYGDYLVGKTLVLWTNFVGDHNNTTQKLGYARPITLVGTGLVSEVYLVKKGSSIGVKRLRVYVKDSPHGRVYLNSNFGYSIENTAELTPISETNTSMAAGITDCNNSGTAYVDVNITAIAGGDGELKLINLRVGSEF